MTSRDGRRTARGWPRRLLIGIAAGLLLGLGVSSAAHADPAAPTDFRSTVRSVTPPTESIDVDIVGGDSFVELTAERGTEVVVVGYRGEPWLRFRPDGTVEENRRSPSLYLSQQRYGGGDLPPEASADAAAEWQVVGSGGRFVWHDHRSHLMVRGDPPNAEPGERVQRSRIPLQVDGATVEVAIVTDWLPAPSSAPLVAGAAAGGLVVVSTVLSRRRMAWALALAAVAAGGIGWWQFSSLPPETEPRALWWILPAVGAGSALLGLLLGRRATSHALIALGALELGAWVFIRRDGLTRAILPTEAPFWLDRGVTAAAGVAAVAAAASAVVGLFRVDG